MRSRFAPYTLLAAVVLAPAALGGQQAATSAAPSDDPSLIDPSTIYYACYVPSSGTVYRIKTADTPSACTKSTHVEFSWNHQGPIGPQGPQGPQGPKGDPGVVTLPYSGTMSSAGNVFEIINSGSGVAGRFSAGSGIALSAKAVTGVGLHASSAFGAAGLKAEHSSTTGTALEVSRGMIRVAGAGMNTPTAVFQVQGPHNTDVRDMYIDNPMTNGNPNLILIVTRVGLQRGHVEPFAVGYDAAVGKWWIGYEYPGICVSASFCDGVTAPKFNILVIKP